MPTYPFVCTECGHTDNQRLTFAQYDAVKASTSVVACAQCGKNMQFGFEPGAVSFVLKEGPSGGWVTKAGKEKAYRVKRNQVMARREKDHVFKNKLQPNYNGADTGSWREAQAMARSEKGEKIAATYNDMVASESKR